MTLIDEEDENELDRSARRKNEIDQPARRQLGGLGLGMQFESS